ncbi:MAG: hypothetical protein WBA51_00315 [Erythrobacter sp.]
MVLPVVIGAAGIMMVGPAFAQGVYQSPVPALLQGTSGVSEALPAAPTYVDLVTLADTSELVLRVKIRRQTALKPERAPGLAPGFARLYIEAETLALISGSAAIGESLVYLVDVPLDAKGKVPRLKKREMLLFANLAGRAGDGGARGAAQLQLTARQAQLDYTPELEARLRPILSDLVAGDVPPVITGINDALAVPGTLTGESETQIFLATQDRSPVSLTVLRRPGQRPVWGVSWGEIIDSAARAPARETLRWYRLACSLPDSLPSSANLARDPAARRLAVQDYEMVLRELGPCNRVITQAPPV